MSSRSSQRLVRIAGRAALLATTLSLGACAQMSDLGLGGATASKEPETSIAAIKSPTSELEKATAYWGKEVTKNPRDGKAAINYARNLKALGRKQDALVALQNAYLFNGENTEFLSEYGRLALDAGQVNLASQLLERADDPSKPDWRVISARGTALAKQGQYKEALPFFERARELAPTQASVLNNLAMAYTMDGQAERAEELLRQAQSGSSDPRVKQNLALVLGLQGKNAEARSLASDEADAPAPMPAASAQAPSAHPDPVKPVKAVASAPMTAPVTPVSATPLDPDEIIRRAIDAEAAKNAPPSQPVSTSSTRKPRKTASADDAPALKSTR